MQRAIAAAPSILASTASSVRSGGSMQVGCFVGLGKVLLLVTIPAFRQLPTVTLPTV